MTVHVDLGHMLALRGPVAVVNPPLVVGIDTSMTCTGIADNTGRLNVVQSVGKKTDTYEDRRARITSLVDSIVSHVPDTTDLVIIEGPSYGSASPSAWDRAYLWWTVYDRLWRRGMSIAVASPSSRMLYAAGKGNAPKGVVFEAAKDRLGGTWSSFAGDDNKADAAWLCALGCDYLGVPLAVMPAKNRAALVKVAWPAVMAS